MITLARHIELLLLEHDCVIVPGLGGFIANHAFAQYNSDSDSLFLPPYRTIGFNQQLQMNDGLLVQSYMSAYDASYPAAYLQMEKEIEQVCEKLDNEGVCELEGIGTLTKSLNQNITFTSHESGITSPSLYGLYSFEIKSLEAVIKDEEIKKALKAAEAMRVGGDTSADDKSGETKEHKKGFTIHISRKWIDLSVSAAAAVALFFGLSYSTLKTPSANDGDTCVAAACVNPNLEHKMAKKTSDAKQENRQSETKNDEQKVQDIKDESKIITAQNEQNDIQQEKTEQKVEEAKYSIVLASCVGEANSNDFIKMLDKKGLVGARFVKTGNVGRVLFSAYATEQEAHSALQELRKQASEFAEAWVLAL